MQSRRRTKKEETEKQPQLPLGLPAGAAAGLVRRAVKQKAAVCGRAGNARMDQAGPAPVRQSFGGNGVSHGADRTQTTGNIIHVFVDFENVCEVDPSIFENHRVHFTLLVGAGQTRLDTNLVEQLLRHAPSVQFVRMTSRGRNALDFALAYYLGRAVEAMPKATFCIISRDKGFDPLVEHLSANQVTIRRYENFSDIAPKPSAVRPVVLPAAPAVSPRPGRESSPALQEKEGLFGRAVEYLSRNSTSRPRTHARLLRWLTTSCDGHVSLTTAERVVEELRKKKYISVNGSGGVSYTVPSGVVAGRV